MWREPTEQEKSILALVEISDGLEDLALVYSEALRSFHEAAIRQIGDWVRSGKLGTEDLLGPDVLDYPGRDGLRTVLIQLQEQMAEFGKAQAEAEITRIPQGLDK